MTTLFCKMKFSLAYCTVAGFTHPQTIFLSPLPERMLQVWSLVHTALVHPTPFYYMHTWNEKFEFSYQPLFWSGLLTHNISLTKFLSASISAFFSSLAISHLSLYAHLSPQMY